MCLQTTRLSRFDLATGEYDGVSLYSSHNTQMMGFDGQNVCVSDTSGNAQCFEGAFGRHWESQRRGGEEQLLCALCVVRVRCALCVVAHGCVLGTHSFGAHCTYLYVCV